MACLSVVLDVSAAIGQSFPFDHWFNDYWDVVVAHSLRVSDHLLWPPSRLSAAKILALRGHGPVQYLPGWAYDLLARELRNELRSIASVDSFDQWDWWRVGTTGWSGPRRVARSRSPSLWSFGEGTFHFSQRAYVYLRLRASDDPNAVPSYTGIPRKKRRLGFNTAEADYAYAGYEGKWLSVKFGRFKQSWGPGDSRSVWLNVWGPAYDGLNVKMKYHGFQLSFFSVFLETVTDSSQIQDVNRYLSGHFLTYSNDRSFVVGAGELSLYSGPFRPLSLTYANPFMSYLEYENNERTNVARRIRNLDNWSLAVCGEWYPWANVRLWGMWLIDDIQIDREKRPNATALKVGASWAPRSSAFGVFRTDYVRVGTWTYRHQELYVNYESRGLPIGYDGGSDVQIVRLSWTGFPFNRILAKFWFQYREQGEMDIRRDPYGLREFPYGWPFPSGVVEKVGEVGFSLHYQPRYNLWIRGGISWRRMYSGPDVLRWEQRFSGFLAVSVYHDFSTYGVR